MDLESLQRELAGKAPHSSYEDSADEDYDDPYAEYAYWNEEDQGDK
ncbi:hypothetical protein J2S56_002272 [Corynebacterium lowii]|nr:hypothetical protein [Corynebacterium lowii]